MRLERGRRKEGPEVVQQRVDVRSGVAHRNRNLDIDDRIPSRGESAGQGKGPREFRRGTTNTGEDRSRLGSRPRELHVVFHRDGFCRPDVADRVDSKRVSGVRTSIDSK